MLDFVFWLHACGPQLVHPRARLVHDTSNALYVVHISTYYVHAAPDSPDEPNFPDAPVALESHNTHMEHVLCDATVIH